MRLSERILSPSLTLSDGRTVRERRSRTLPVLIVLLLFTLVSLYVTDFSFSVLLKRGGQFRTVLSRMFPPDTDYLGSVWSPLCDTILMSAAGTALGALLAVPFSVLASGNIVKRRWVVSIFRFLFSLLRTLPTLVTALLLTFLYGLGTTAGTLSIAVFTFSYCGKLLYEEIESADISPYEAALAQGATKARAALTAVLPQVLPLYLSSVLYSFESSVRYASVLGYVGAGGIGLILNSEMGWRNYPRVGMILLSLFVTVALVEITSTHLRRMLEEGNAGRKMENGRNATVDEMYAAGRREAPGKIIVPLLAVALVVLSGRVLDFSVSDSSGGRTAALSIVRSVLHPDTSLLFTFSENGVPYLLFETLSTAFLGTLFGAVLAVPLSFLSAENITGKYVSWIFRTAVMAVRTVPSFVYALMFIRVTGPGAAAGVLTMSLSSVGMISRMFTEEVENLDRGVTDSLSSLGCSTFERIRYAIVPSLSASFLSILIYRFDVNLRDTSVLGIVGAGGIGAPLVFAVTQYRWNQAGAILLGLGVLVLAVEWLSSGIRKRIMYGD